MKAGTHHDVPLPTNALSRLRNRSDALRPDLVPVAQRIAGTIGFITNQVCPDAHFSYCALARYMNEERMTQQAFDYLIRVGNYIVSTKELCLTLTTPTVTSSGLDLFSVYCDSSMGSIVPEGLSQGGFVLLSNGQAEPDGSRRGGGAFTWKCEAPVEGDDSSAAAELRMLARAIKTTVAARITQRDLDIGIAPTAPTSTGSGGELKAAAHAR